MQISEFNYGLQSTKNKAYSFNIDTAMAYRNEAGVGKAVRKSGIPRQEIFITTKIPAEIKNYMETIETIKKSLENLAMETIDLLLIHAPKPSGKFFIGFKKTYFEENIAVWTAMEEAYKSEYIKLDIYKVGGYYGIC